MAGVVGGQSLVKQAKLRNTFTKIQNYKTSIMIFKSIYNDLPGDFRRATSYWPGQTINGNGDKRIIGWGSPAEDHAFFEQLSFAEVINESFNSIAYSGANSEMYIGQNYPRTPFNNVTIYPINTSDPAGGGYVTNQNVLVLAEQNTIYIAQAAAISAKDALDVDSKLDDGIYNNGIIHSLTGAGSATQCIIGGDYNLASGDIVSCRVQFLF